MVLPPNSADDNFLKVDYTAKAEITLMSCFYYYIKIHTSVLHFEYTLNESFTALHDFVASALIVNYQFIELYKSLKHWDVLLYQKSMFVSLTNLLKEGLGSS